MVDHSIPSTVTASNEIDLLDLLVIVAENIKLLILGPLLVGLATLGVSFILPPTYESNSLVVIEKIGLPLSSDVVLALATSSSMFDAVAQDMGLLAKGLSPHQARQYLQKHVMVSVGRADKLLKITTTAEQPQQAQRLNQLVLQHIYAQTIPRGDERSRLEQLLENEEAIYDMSIQLQKSLSRLLTSGRVNEQTENTLLRLLDNSSARIASIQSLYAKLQGLGPDNLVHPPTLSERAIGPKKAQITFIASLATLFALLLFVFVRQAFRNSSTQARSASKLARIQQAFRW